MKFHRILFSLPILISTFVSPIYSMEKIWHFSDTSSENSEISSETLWPVSEKWGAHVIQSMAPHIKGMSEIQFKELHKEALDAYIEKRFTDAYFTISEKILDFVPKQLIADIYYKEHDSHLEEAKKHLRLGLAIIPYVHGLSDKIFEEINKNKELIEEYKVTDPKALKKLVARFKLNDGIYIPEGIQKLIRKLIRSNNLTPECLNNWLVYYKNKYVAEEFSNSSYSFLIALNDVTSTTERVDMLLSSSLLSKWAACRLSNNTKPKEMIVSSPDGLSQEDLSETFLFKLFEEDQE